ncbi:transcriptional regulator, AraC/XylS family protein [Lentisphaera araneosa HTCC2155]|uniref:Transcriptional regulator, AraC/XylS family protein n=1 Tax=Lentisphaera araneosa HTCC2155 TaxID=313628 RepID=A6DM00_9BACT|nr:AraC family transcriptional regulator [Lentisphaera araneosa]EDM27298.1 transcriptional regulator, AraC/XylS family protein [Lentisphaera araneosa HTCC2155]
MLNKFNQIKYGNTNLFFKNINFELPYKLLNFGRERVVSSDYRWHGLKRGKLETAIWQYTLSGSGKLRSNNTTYTIQPHQAMLVTSPDDHEYFFDSMDSHWEFIYLSFCGTDLVQHYKNLIAKTSPVCSLPINSKLISLFLQLTQNPHLSDSQTQVQHSQLCYQFIMELHQEILADKQKPLPQAIQNVLNHINHHLNQAISIDEMASVAKLSRYHFSRVFSKAIGISPNEYLIKTKMEYAQKLLFTQNLSVKQLAHECGYHDPSYFCKVFKKHFGHSPKADLS